MATRGPRIGTPYLPAYAPSDTLLGRIRDTMRPTDRRITPPAPRDTRPPQPRLDFTSQNPSGGPGFPTDPGTNGGGAPSGSPSIFDTGVAIGCGQLSGWQRDLCMSVGTYIGQTYLSPNQSPGTSCPPGHVERNGGCVPTTPTADPMQSDLGQYPGEDWQTVMSPLGVPAVVPFDVGDIRRADGSVGPILRCPAKHVLGPQSLCYLKGSIPNTWRKWPKGPKPLLSAMDGKILRHARSVEKRLRRVSSKYVPRPRRCSTTRKRK